jgi:hypothetical protein
VQCSNDVGRLEAGVCVRIRLLLVVSEHERSGAELRGLRLIDVDLIGRTLQINANSAKLQALGEALLGHSKDKHGNIIDQEIRKRLEAQEDVRERCDGNAKSLDHRRMLDYFCPSLNCSSTAKSTFSGS